MKETQNQLNVQNEPTTNAYDASGSTCDANAPTLSWSGKFLCKFQNYHMIIHIKNISQKKDKLAKIQSNFTYF